MRVYIVSFAPSTDEHGVGGFTWTPSRKRADEVYCDEVKDSAHHGGSHIVRLVSAIVPRAFDLDDPLGCAEVTSLIDCTLIEGIENWYPAHRQYIPPCTEASRLPGARRTW